MDNRPVDKWQHADEKVKEKLPPGVKLVRTLRGHTDWVIKIAWSSDGQFLVSSSGDKTIKLWNAETGECLRTIEGCAGSFGIAFDPTSSMYATGSSEGDVKLWEVASGKLLHNLEGHSGDVFSLEFDPTGRTLASGGDDKVVKLWDVTSGKLLYILEGHYGSVTRISFDPTGRTLATGSDEGDVKLWEVASGKLLHDLEKHSGGVFSLEFDPTGRTLASGSNRGDFKLWEVTSGKLLQKVEAESNNICIFSFDPQGRILAQVDGHSRIRLWETGNGMLSRVLEGHTGDVYSVDFAPNIPLFASRSTHQREILLWRADTFDCLTKINFGKSNHDWSNSNIVFHPYLPLLAVVVWDTSESNIKPQVIHIWELDLSTLLSQPATPMITYTSAKIVLVGDSGVGKTGLGWRLAHEEFKEHSSTHGQQFWLLDQLCKQRSDGAQCETVLWDLAGQPDYRLIHALFLDDAD